MEAQLALVEFAYGSVTFDITFYWLGKIFEGDFVAILAGVDRGADQSV